jgi:hypothetical protein
VERPEAVASDIVGIRGDRLCGGAAAVSVTITPGKIAFDRPSRCRRRRRSAPARQRVVGRERGDNNQQHGDDGREPTNATTPHVTMARPSFAPLSAVNVGALRR